MSAQVPIPSHLRRTYPADMSLFLGLLALIVMGGWPDENSVIQDTWENVDGVLAGIAAICLLLGWLRNSRRSTYEGAWLATGIWAAELTEALFFRELGNPMWWFAFIMSAAMLNLAVGVWWFVRRTPEEEWSEPNP